MGHIEKIMEFAAKFPTLYLYGAGEYGATFAEELRELGIQVKGFIVTQTKSEQMAKAGLPVLDMKQIQSMERADECGVVLSLGIKYHAEVVKTLEKAHFINYFCPSEDMISMLIAQNRNRVLFELLEEKSKIAKLSCIKPVWNRILVTRLDGIGDAVLMTPFLRTLRANSPKSHITLIVQPMVYNLFEECPYIDKLLVYNWHEIQGLSFKERLHHAQEYMQVHNLVGNIDIAMNPRWDADSYNAAALIYFSEAPHRIAWSENVLPRKRISDYGFDALYTMVMTDRRICHEVEHNMQFLTQLGINVTIDHEPK